MKVSDVNRLKELTTENAHPKKLLAIADVVPYFWRMSRLFRLGLVALFVTLPGVDAAAQQQPTFRAGVDLIQVDVTVVDGDSYPVTDLEASDFTVTVDGEPRPVVQAQFISLRPQARRPVLEPQVTEDVVLTTNTDQTPGRLVVIAVDEESFLFGEGRHVMRAAAEFVDSLSRADRVGLAVIPYGLHIDFTSDHGRVRQALLGLSGLGTRRQDVEIGLGEAYRIAEFNDRGTEILVARRLCGIEAENDQGCVSTIRSRSRQIVQQSRDESVNSRRGLETLLGAMEELEGPNTLLWISGGLIIEDQFSLREIQRRASASRTALYLMMVAEPLIDMTRQAFQETARDDRRQKEQGLLELAALTGARVLRAQYNPTPLFEQMERELSGYYLLGVQLGPTDRDVDRRPIEVSVAREGVRVRARQEISFAEDEARQAVDERLARMLRSPFSVLELPIRVATYVHHDAETERMRVLVATEVGGDALGPLTFGVVLRDADGRSVWTGQQEVDVQPTYTASGPILETSFQVQVPPGQYELRLAVVDDIGQRGSVEHPIHADVRSNGPLAVGDLVVADRPQAGARVEAPVVARVSDGRLAAYTELYADSPTVWEQTQVHIAIADHATGPVRAETTVTFHGGVEMSRRVLRYDVEVGELPPGRYVARALVVHDSGEVARLHRPFQIIEAP